MFPHIPFEAAFLRTALLLGLIREADVHDWAEALLATESDADGALAEVVLAQPELTALRSALQPIGQAADETDVAASILAFMALDPGVAGRAPADRIRILSQLRESLSLPSSVGSAIKLFHDRWMLAAAGISSDKSPSNDELDQWLESVRSPAYFRASIERAEERAAFLAALSRKVVRDRRWQAITSDELARAWVVRFDQSVSDTLLLNERLWRAAVREFSPLPIATRIPYGALPAGAVILFEENGAVAMSAADAAHCLGTR